MARFTRRKDLIPTTDGIEMTPVESSHIIALGFSPERNLLVVDFRGARWAYKEVKKETFDALIGAESHGKYFSANIKGKYESVKIFSKQSASNG